MTTTSSGEVVVGFDGSPDSMRAVHWAERYALATHGRLLIVAVWHWPALVGAPPTGYNPDIDAKAAVERAIDDLALPTAQVATRVIEGRPGYELVEASRGADLLVVGNRGRGGISSLLGSVSTYCVHHANIPVAVVRTSSESATKHEVAEHHTEDRTTSCHDDYTNWPAAD